VNTFAATRLQSRRCIHFPSRKHGISDASLPNRNRLPIEWRFARRQLGRGVARSHKNVQG
jgi:hypothetical protein